MRVTRKGKNLEQVSKKLKQIKREAVETRKEVERANGSLYGSGGNLNSRQQAGGGTG